MGPLSRKLTAIGALCAAIAVAGCGGDDEAAGPLDNALGYLPEDAPLVVTVDTDLEGEQFKAIQAIVKKFPISGQIEERLKESLDQQSFDFEQDIKPLLGNELVVGAADPRSLTGGGESSGFVVAIQAKDAAKLDDLVDRQKADEVGEKDGAKIYEGSDGNAFAVEDDVLVVADSRRQLESAIEQRDGEDRFTEETLDEGTEGLPEDTLVRLYGNLQTLLESDPDTARARKVEWVGALRTLGMTASAADDRIDVDFRVTTEGDLTEDDLPIASGDESPPVVARGGEIGVGVRDLAQILKFGERAAQAANPSGFSDYATAKRTLEARLDVDVEKDILEQTDEVSLSISLNGKFGVRAEPKDPAEFERTLGKLGDGLTELLDGARIVEPPGGKGLYTLVTGGGDRIVYGVVDGVFVLSNDPGRARALADASPKEVPGAKGAVAMSADTQEVVTQFLRGRLSGLQALGGAFVAGPLGQLTGSISATTDAVSGKFTLTFD